MRGRRLCLIVSLCLLAGAGEAFAAEDDDDYLALENWIAAQEKPKSEAERARFADDLAAKLAGFIAKHPDSRHTPRVRQSLAALLFQARRWDEARAQFETFAGAEGEAGERARYSVVVCLLRVGKRKAAREQLESYRERHGDEAWMAEMAKHLEEAEAAAKRAAALKRGAEAPPFAATTIAGHEITLAGQRGKVVLLYFWATWCEPCKKLAAPLRDLERQLREEGLVVVGVSLDEPRGVALDAVRAYVAEHEMVWPQLYEGVRELLAAYGVKAVPRFVLIDGEGRILEPELLDLGAVRRAVERATKRKE